MCACGRLSNQYCRGHSVVPIDLRALTLLEQKLPTFLRGLLSVTITLLGELREASKRADLHCIIRQMLQSLSQVLTL